MGLGEVGRGQISVWAWANLLTTRRPGRGRARWGKIQHALLYHLYINSANGPRNQLVHEFDHLSIDVTIQ